MINLINYTIYLPKGHELKNDNVYNIEIKNKIRCECNNAVSMMCIYNLNNNSEIKYKFAIN